MLIPKRMNHLRRDHRGYPIPASVLIDSNGKAHFTINDELARQRQIAQKKCPICDGRLKRGRWFVGGPLSAFHPNGAYIDLPMHDECAHYALQVCPYLAAPNYSSRIDAQTLKDNTFRVLKDNTMIPDRPALFVAVLTTGHKLIRNRLSPNKPYVRVEYWRRGQRIDDAEGTELVEQIMGTPLPPMQPQRLVIRDGKHDIS